MNVKAGVLGWSKKLRARVVPGKHTHLRVSDFDAAECEEEIEINGYSLDHYLSVICSLDDGSKETVVEAMQNALNGPTPQNVLDQRYGRKALCWRENVRLQILSWNVAYLKNNASPKMTVTSIASKMFRDVLGGDKDNPDVIVVGLQRIAVVAPDMLLRRSFTKQVLENSNMLDLENAEGNELVTTWANALLRAINKDGSGSTPAYALANRPIFMGGLLMCVFSRPELLGMHLRSFVSCAKSVDSFSRNGCVACRFNLFERSFCFLNFDMPGDQGTSRRNRRRSAKTRLNLMRSCFSRILFKRGDQTRWPVNAHRAVFVLGNTNVRLAKPFQFGRYQKFLKHAHETVQNNDWSSLVQHDQLHQFLARTNRWREAAIGTPQFPPTYRLMSPGSGWDKRSVPAWTDRITFRSSDVSPVTYRVVEQGPALSTNVSTRNPVFGLFDVGCVRVSTGGFIKLLHQTLGVTAEDHEVVDEQLEYFTSSLVHAATQHIEDFTENVERCVQEMEGPMPGFATAALLLVQDEIWANICERIGDEFETAVERCHNAPGGVNPDVLEQELSALVGEDFLRQSEYELAVVAGVQRPTFVSRSRVDSDDESPSSGAHRDDSGDKTLSATCVSGSDVCVSSDASTGHVCTWASG